MYTINLLGPFEIWHSKRGPCKPRSKKQCALIALLATANHKRRSRTWLKTVLWSEKDDEAASANLRQALRSMRKHFGANMLVDSDNFDIWLVDGAFAVDDRSDPNAEFLEGIDVDEEPFEDWLREERSRIEDAEPIPYGDRSSDHQRGRSGELPQHGRLPRVLLQVKPPQSVSEAADAILRFASSKIGNTLHEWSVAQIVDPGSQLVVAPDSDPMIDYVLVVQCLEAISGSEVSCGLYRAHDSTLAETIVLELDTAQGALETREEIFRFIERGAFTLAARIALDARAGVISSPTVYSIYDLFAPDRGRQIEGLNRIASLADESGVARAWMAYGQVVCTAECTVQTITRDEVQANCALALEAAPYHPIVNALLGHINAFFFRDFSRAEEHLSLAKSQSPRNSIVLSHYAASENYFGSPERGLRFAQRAIELNPNSFVRYIFDCDLQMSMALRGRHAEAAVLGERVLRASPDFLGAKRYLMASYAQIGAHDKAKMRVSEIRSLDANFTSEGVARSDYPLPSDRSIALISDSLKLVGY